jgi:orotate phosphoribosyltransferase
MNILDQLQRVGAVFLDHHFVYKSGKHGPGYICMDPIYADPVLLRNIVESLLEPWGLEYHVISAPATGGVALAGAASNFVLYQKGLAKPALWADKDGKEFVVDRLSFPEGVRGKKVLIVEDLLTTGSSVVGTRKAIEACGGEVIGVSVVCNRGGVTAEDLGVPKLEQLTHVSFDAYEADECPMCAACDPIVVDGALGHGATYRDEHPNYAGDWVNLLGSAA